MNEIVIKRKQAKLRLEMLEQEVRTGRATPQDVENARRAYEDLRDGKAPETPVVVAEPTSSVATRKFDEQPKQLSDSTKLILDGLNKELNTLDADKAALSNSLKTVPKDGNAKHITDQILNLRDQRANLMDTIRYVQVKGCLPSAAPVVKVDFEGTLPKDKFTLDRMMKNLKINLTKWQDKRNAAKTLAKIQEYDTKLAKGRTELDTMIRLFQSL